MLFPLHIQMPVAWHREQVRIEDHVIVGSQSVNEAKEEINDSEAATHPW